MDPVCLGFLPEQEHRASHTCHQIQFPTLCLWSRTYSVLWMKKQRHRHLPLHLPNRTDAGVSLYLLTKAGFPNGIFSLWFSRVKPSFKKCVLNLLFALHPARVGHFHSNWVCQVFFRQCFFRLICFMCLPGVCRGELGGHQIPWN